jgi:hypothetical protein
MRWLSTNYTWIFDGAGVAVVVFVLEWLRRRFSSKAKEKTATFAAHGSSVTNPQTAGGDGNIQNVFAPVLNLGPQPNSALASTKTADALPEPEPLPNLIFVEAAEKKIIVSAWPDEGFHDFRTSTGTDRFVDGLIFKFENKTVPGLRIKRAMDVIAQLRFRSENNVTRKRIPYGVWLKSRSWGTSFEVGDTCELVVVCIVQNEMLTFEDRRDGRYFGEAFTYFEEFNVDWFQIVEVTLIDRATQFTKKDKFKIWRDGNHFGVYQTT